jgi:hypothetical protein
MRHSIFILVASILLIGCTKEIFQIVERPVEVEDSRDVRFYLDVRHNAQSLLRTVDFTLFDSTGLLLLPYITENRSFVISFDIPENALVYMGEDVLKSGETRVDFTNPVHISVIYKDSQVQTFHLSFHVFTGLPIFWIDAEGPEIPRETFVKGQLRLDGNGSGTHYSEPIGLEIRGRGNSTWGMPKKPYRIRFNQNTSVLGLPATRNWVLLANFADKTLLRNDVAFELGRQLTSDFVPRSNFVELFLNGEYQGTYQLTDQIRVEAARVNIPSLRPGDTDSAIITGGYLLEIDERLDANTWFYSKTFNLPVCIKDPENPNQAQLNYITNYFNKMEEMIMSENAADPENGLEKYIDLQSFLDWFLVNELTKNNDAVFFSSVFMHKNRNGKLKMGPLWDFDIALGNVIYHDNASPEGWWIRTSNLYFNLFKNPVFESKLKARWAEWKNDKLPNIFNHINNRSNKLRFAQEQNFNKWGTLYTNTWPNSVVLGTYENEVQYLKDWLNKRIIWMDGQLK